MRNSIMRIRTLVVALGLGAALIPSGAHAQATVSLPASDIYGFLPSQLVVTKGAAVTFVNLDPIASPAGAPHDVRSTSFRTTKDRAWCVNFPGTQKCPLLYTPSIGAGETTVVQGVADLTGGVPYAFYCTWHSEMKGTITVVA